ncbi:YciI family protein [Hyphomonas jannaschiana]|uniref:YCII-like protein n=1 Tax=Hyphomonas jannaschiana VP2 TaxID=1280952 RepID=A0A059F8D1_9PROT|nr:YciI family protein [Hyphomonas jannaschiana]KCZ86813.1 YCII-like protein [Hyphomonas jannaschiana VP2]
MAHFIVKLAGACPERTNQANVEAHVAWLETLHDTGKLSLCGPCDDGTAIIVLSCGTLEEAIEIANSDPFVESGAYATRTVHAFQLATPENNFLLSSPA